MAYMDTTELAFAKGYYHIGLEKFGVVRLEENTPEEIREKFWREWPKYHKKVTDLQKQGIFDSKYPILPMVDPDENKKHYEGGE